MRVLEEKHHNNFTGGTRICQKLRNWYKNDWSFGNIALFNQQKSQNHFKNFNAPCLSISTLNITFGCTTEQIIRSVMVSSFTFHSLTFHSQFTDKIVPHFLYWTHARAGVRMRACKISFFFPDQILLITLKLQNK